MHVKSSDDDAFSNERADQSASEKMKSWMRTHGWSIAFSADPCELLEFLQEHGDDADFDNFSIQTETR